MHFGNRLRQERLRLHLSQEALAEALAISARSIRRWEQGQALPQASVRLQLSRFFGLRSEALFEDEETQTPHEPLWNVPYPRNPFFTGREEILTTLHTSLYVEQIAFTQAYALQGLGGVGKTQIALEYAYRYAQEYQAVFWIGAETAESIIFGLLRIAESLQVPERDGKDQQQVITAVHHWFTTHDRWLLICDNVEDLGMLKRFLPPARQGAILFTTRLRTLGTSAEGINLLPMEHEEGILFLLRRAKVVKAQATSEQVRQLSTQMSLQYAAGVELVTATGGLPLALDQAGAYLEETQCGLPAYLDLFRTRRAILLQQRGEGALDHPASVSTTFTLAITVTAQRHPVVWDLLRVCALLQPDAIPDELFRQGARHLGAMLEAACGDALDWNQVVAVACSYSLLLRQPEAQALSIHRLVQAVLLDIMTEAERKEWASRVVEALDAVFPEEQPMKEYTTWKKQCDRLISHVLLCLHRAGDSEDSLALASLAYKTAQYLRERGQYGEAKPYYQRALHIREQILGPDHYETASVLHNLAVLYWKMGKYAEAEPLLQRALLIRGKTLDMDHPDVATTLNYLALLYWKMGKYAEAEPLLQRALHIWEQALNPDHPNIAYPLNNLAILYAEQGKYAEAEPLFQRALHIWEQSKGSEHPDVAQALHNLAELSLIQEKYAEAESLYQRVLHLRVQAHGPDHPSVAETLNSLATLYQNQGKFAEAEALYQRVLHIWEQSQGADHPYVALVLNELANLARDQGKYAEAEPLYQQTLSIREQQLGQQHPETAQTLHDMAIFSQKQGDLRKALSFAERALEIRSQSLGEEHPKTVTTRELYAQLAQKQGGAEQGLPSPETSRMDA
ncbi:FxSxx-COOH system tetratricopeptide repeat protein [Ktedonobacter racemifer]|uniref:Transcriptional regulator, XRE family n=1 Tax=Ktedonobacter racemifer DSM 44963 TaxID=485913 RepID=D6U1H0_KTERA|nr:FxSxx-COOH system tetratricopeptide repeat protein [Ktedonobacter racemifer]EFH82614.1 transcriptional regulator, XRE family [Ktedonobacter racemifer DSM 44963]